MIRLHAGDRGFWCDVWDIVFALVGPDQVTSHNYEHAYLDTKVITTRRFFTYLMRT